jgi:hypothetical protein
VNEFEYDDDLGDELVPEEWPTVATPIPVWILLADLSAQAYKMYGFLAEHINASIRDPRQRIACPKQKAIALALGLSSDRKVARYRRELEEIGAIRVEEFRYAGGMRRGYRYFVRYNPPTGYAGLMRLKEFYAAHPEIRSAAKWAGRTEEAKAVAASVPPQAGRRADQGQAPADGAAAAAKPKTKAGKRGDVALPPEVLRVLAAFPEPLRAAMRETAHTDTPKTLVTAVAKALQDRTAEQLVDRVCRRWWLHGYEAKFEAGELARPVGAAVAMLRHGECPDLRCEDGEVLDTGAPCRLCIERGKDYKAERAAARKAQKEAAEAARRRVMCPACERDQGTNGAVCPACVAGFEREIAAAAERAAADVAALPEARAEHPAQAREHVLAEAQHAREKARDDGASDLGQLLAARMAAETAAREAHQLRMAAVSAPQDQAPEIPAQPAAPSSAPVREPVPCRGTKWDGSPCHRPTAAEDGLCTPCRATQRVQEEDLATAG